MSWREYDRGRGEPAPPLGESVWIVEDDGEVDIGYHAGSTFYRLANDLDVQVTHWMPMERPAPPDAPGVDG
ncbi:hypothetical protein [Micromonospora sp. NBC_01813]|uniref:hypothetical protein n=1 Tax=Micromonospora sp. NBC_01813 TaxID=2975988 RepID=UPI002DD94E24|nr:hypothetical protein [Micromonospora sp. NBC_01813]WSA11517.1 hypothetical protein OG958_12465 [Micromonospora sp. NBC_01813]